MALIRMYTDWYVCGTHSHVCVWHSFACILIGMCVALICMYVAVLKDVCFQELAISSIDFDYHVQEVVCLSLSLSLSFSLYLSLSLYPSISASVSTSMSRCAGVFSCIVGDTHHPTCISLVGDTHHPTCHLFAIYFPIQLAICFLSLLSFFFSLVLCCLVSERATDSKKGQGFNKGSRTH